MNHVIKHAVIAILVFVAGAGAAFAVFVMSGVYNFAADDPHTPAVSSLLETMRERSVAARAGKQIPADLAGAQRVVQGAGNYEAMCVGCHLAPGLPETELSKGLYPAPPNLTQEKVEPGQAFWVIKHGIKASGMPAWGKSMGDEDIWNLTAFLGKLPGLDEDGYRGLVQRSEGHHHGGGESAPHGHAEAPMPPAHGKDASSAHSHAADDAHARKPPHHHSTDKARPAASGPSR